MFKKNSKVHSVNTTEKHDLFRPLADLLIYQKGANYSGIKLYTTTCPSKLDVYPLTVNHLK
jgi:hypothetical protein